VRFVAPGAPSTGVPDTTLNSTGLMTWHEAAPPVTRIALKDRKKLFKKEVG